MGAVRKQGSKEASRRRRDGARTAFSGRGRASDGEALGTLCGEEVTSSGWLGRLVR